MLLLSEYEFVVWTCFCQPETINALLGSPPRQSQQSAIKLVMNHLINTAFFTKEHTSSDQVFKLIRIFFENNFQVF